MTFAYPAPRGLKVPPQQKPAGAFGKRKATPAPPAPPEPAKRPGKGRR